ncbi:hypothetical protein GCM10027430_36060 [Lysobacter tyrosinilyticus]
MSVLRQLLVISAFALAALLLIAGVMAGVAAVDSAAHSNSLLSPFFAAMVTFCYTLALGTLPALLLGAPGYVFLLRTNRAHWHYVLALGVMPGIAVLPLDLNIGFWAIGCGGVVALLTHFARRRLGPNNSFKPKPLRGSA